MEKIAISYSAYSQQRFLKPLGMFSVLEQICYLKKLKVLWPCLIMLFKLATYNIL